MNQNVPAPYNATIYVSTDDNHRLRNAVSVTHWAKTTSCGFVLTATQARKLGKVLMNAAAQVQENKRTLAALRKANRK